MKYNKVEAGDFQKRPNQFATHVEINGKRSLPCEKYRRASKLLVPGALV